jgi:hypothetical protein
MSAYLELQTNPKGVVFKAEALKFVGTEEAVKVLVVISPDRE